jgi:hypothetical protein
MRVFLGKYNRIPKNKKIKPLRNKTIALDA